MDTPTITPTIGLLIVGLVGAVVGAIINGGTILVVVGRLLRNVNDNAPLLTAIEGLIASAPPEVLAGLEVGAADLATLAEILRKVSDGLPNTTVGEAERAALEAIAAKVKAAG